MRFLNVRNCLNEQRIRAAILVANVGEAAEDLMVFAGELYKHSPQKWAKFTQALERLEHDGFLFEHMDEDEAALVSEQMIDKPIRRGAVARALAA